LIKKQQKIDLEFKHKRDKLMKDLVSQGVFKSPELAKDREQFQLLMRKQEFETNKPSQETLFQMKNEEN